MVGVNDPVDNGIQLPLGDMPTGAIKSELGAAGLELRPKESPATVRMPNIGELSSRPYEQASRMVCFCERVTLGEIEAAFGSTIPPVDLDGLRRRTRVLMGRCQGFYCGARVAALLREATA